MKRKINCLFGFLSAVVIALTFLASPLPASAREYAALDGVKGLDSVFDFSLGSPQMAVVVLQAVRGVYQNEEVRALHAPPRTVIVFHGAAVKLISTEREGFDPADREALDRFADMIRQLKKDGVKMEVCMYAVQVLGVDPATLLPEIDRVGNGFVSVLGYQAQGYSVQSIP